MVHNDLEQEERYSRGTVLGWAVWRRLCQAYGNDPKDPDLTAVRDTVIESIRGAFMVMEDGGFGGLDLWLELEEEFK